MSCQDMGDVARELILDSVNCGFTPEVRDDSEEALSLALALERKAGRIAFLPGGWSEFSGEHEGGTWAVRLKGYHV